MLQFNKRKVSIFCMALLILLPLTALAALGSQAVEIDETLPAFDPMNVSSNASIVSFTSVLIQVTDTELHPLSGATVALQERSNSTKADANGLVLLRDLNPGASYAIYITEDGYEEWSEDYICPADLSGSVSMTIMLQPAGSGSLDSAEQLREGIAGGMSEAPDTDNTSTGKLSQWLLYGVFVELAMVLVLLFLLLKGHEKVLAVFRPKDTDLSPDPPAPIEE